MRRRVAMATGLVGAARVALAVSLGVGIVASPAGAVLPRPAQIANEVAKVNRAAGRGVPLALEVDLEMGSGPGILASGTLMADPRGASRLELTSPRGTWERHLRSDGSLRAVRNGRPLERPRPFLPPLHLLLADRPETLRGALLAIGARPGEVALGFDGVSDCWILGGRRRGPVSTRTDRSAIWVDTETRRVVRIDLAEGVAYRLGPAKRFGRVQLPEWIEAWVDGEPLARLRVRGARRLSPDSSRFAPAWLEAPAPASP